ncbi:hypothetical protein HCN44_000970 [Aphidius gifuensis]|uniref:t-SNARE coiled-coil homology domain-containing protein n=1 Tax=Aphidius gifuensis TaxID=684658 RepID=A0A835CLM5_APHGI|nr:syntaxin-17 [Aphidius gifuensis]KAF7988397.1 hypothetical protein HCN44_000970 [Aphidius gifuensis]
MSMESLSMKQPIKRLEIPISKFNDVAIPHHLDLLRRHKNNIKKFQAARDWDKVQREQINASRLVKQLEQLLHEMDTLRGQVEHSDIEKFDQLTIKSRNSTISAIKEYLEIQFDPPKKIVKPTIEDEEELDPIDQRFLQLQDQDEDVKRQEACLHAWESLQNDLQQLHQLFIDFNKIIYEQKEHVDRVENSVEGAQLNVQEGNKSLEQASRYKVAAYPLAAAFIGSCLGGPVGLLAGIKLGGLTAIACGLLGYTGGTLVKNKQLQIVNQKSDLEISMTTTSSPNSRNLNSQNSTNELKKDI